MKDCPTGCGAEIAPERVMCRDCWEMIPSFRLQEILWRMWRFGKPMPGFEEALASAIEQVNAIAIARREGGARAGRFFRKGGR